MATRALARHAHAPVKAPQVLFATPACQVPSFFFSSNVVGDDLVEVSLNLRTPDGLVARSNQPAGYACTSEEADVLISLLRDGTDYLPTWQAQLATAGFARQYPNAAAGSSLAGRWQKATDEGIIEVTVHDEHQCDDGLVDTSVHALHIGADGLSMQNICGVTDESASAMDVAMRRSSNLPEGIDAAKAGVAALLAILAARKARNGSEAAPLD
jgi:hypothetical protein